MRQIINIKTLFRSFSLSCNKKINWKPSSGRSQEAKKMKCYKRLIFKSQVFVTHSFWVICWNVSCTFVDLCMETPYWCTNMVTGNQKKHLEFTFSIKAISFHSRTSIRVHNIPSNTWNGYTAENQEETRQHSYFGVTHCENSEVQIIVFSKWNSLQEWKLVQRFTCYLSSTKCK